MKHLEVRYHFSILLNIDKINLTEVFQFKYYRDIIHILIRHLKFIFFKTYSDMVNSKVFFRYYSKMWVLHWLRSFDEGWKTNRETDDVSTQLIFWELWEYRNALLSQTSYPAKLLLAFKSLWPWTRPL